MTQWNLITWILSGLIVASIVGIVGYQSYTIKSLRHSGALCDAQVQLQNSAITLEKTQSDLLQAKIATAQKAYAGVVTARDQRAAELDKTPIIDDCTGAVRWGSKRTADLEAKWVDRD